ncbi:MAG: D-alanyl-D-alanine carboxypeptidase, partial [Clostridia bacterium]|nr:D-alanyl-D-alanine carboxypeptidase [Clostridia bacterium]
MKKIFSLAAALLACLPLCSPSVTAAAQSAETGLSAYAAILTETSTGEILYAKNANERCPMASTTKIMTAVVALEHGDLAKPVQIAEKACGVEGSSIYLTAGEELTLEDLLYALMLESANDAAAAIAYEIAGGIEPFAELMNQTAERLGLSDSHFTNPHGLDDEAHYTTAADLAKLTAYALQNPKFRQIVSTYKHQIPLRGDEGVRVLLNHNKLLRMSEDVIGVKTGFTKRSGRCL